MPDGKINIEDMSGEHVATLEWNGDLVNGKGEVKATAGNEKIAKRIKALIQDSKDEDVLEHLQFTTERADMAYVNGWQGFEGYVACLLIVLPKIGLTVSFPSEKTPKTAAGLKDLSEPAKGTID